MMDYQVEINMEAGRFTWSLVEYGKWTTMTVASGTTPDYAQACECALIAWEQHGKEAT